MSIINLASATLEDYHKLRARATSLHRVIRQAEWTGRDVPEQRRAKLAELRRSVSILRAKFSVQAVPDAPFLPDEAYIAEKKIEIRKVNGHYVEGMNSD